MVFGKYNKDYELRETLSPSGRMTSEAVYIGPYFRFAAEPERLKTVRLTAAAATAVSVLSLLVPLVVFGEILQKWYVMVPLVFVILPVSQLVMCVIRAFGDKERVTRREKDRISERLAPWSAVMMILGSLSLIGQIFFDITGGVKPLNIAVHLCTVLIIASGAVIFRVRNGFEMVEADKN